jgi:ABC-type transport system substrate-binding protein
MTTEPGSLSPLFALDDYSNVVDRLAFDVLLTMDRDGRTLVPRLAAAVPSLEKRRQIASVATPDPYTVVFHMKRAYAPGLTTFDLALRKRAYARSQQLLARDVPVVFVYWPKNIAAYDERLHGFAPNPVVPTWNAQDWSF